MAKKKLTLAEVKKTAAMELAKFHKRQLDWLIKAKNGPGLYKPFDVAYPEKILNLLDKFNAQQEEENS